MATGKLITDTPASRVIGKMKIPVTGNFAITPDQLRGYINSSSSIYETTDPKLLPSNGLIQSVALTGDGKLTFDSQSGQEVFLRITGNHVLDLSDFYNVLDYSRDPKKKTFMLIINWNGQMLMFAYDFEDDDAQPIICEGAGSSSIHTFIKRPDTDVEDFKMTIRVDGVDVDPVTPPVFLKVTEYTGDIQIPDGYVKAFKSSFLTENTDSQPHKLEFIINDEVISVFVTGNPSIVDLGSTPYTHYGFCLNTASVQCESSDPKLQFVGLVPDDGSQVIGETELYVDDVLVADQNFPSWLLISSREDDIPVQRPDGYAFAGTTITTFENKDTVNHKVTIKSIFTSQAKGGILGFDNATIYQNSDYTILEACLKGAGGVPVGCEGATNDLSFSHIEGTYDFYIDGDLKTRGGAGTISSWLSKNGYAGKLDIDYDGVFKMTNNTTETYYKVEFVGTDLQPWNFSDPSGNPTFVEHPDVGFSVCLAPQSTLDCEGATLGIVLQMQLPIGTETKFTVNGRTETFSGEAGVDQSAWFANYFGDSVMLLRSDFTTFQAVNSECNSVVVQNPNFVSNAPYVIDSEYGVNSTFKVEGDSISFQLGGAQISCEGATPYAITGELYLDKDTLVKINGNIVDQDSNALIGAVTYGESLFIQSSPVGSYVLQNASDTELRVSIDGTTQWNSGDTGWSENTNPTMEVKFPEGSLTVCLSPSAPKFSGIWDDKMIPEVNKDQLRMILQNGATTADIRQPDGVIRSIYFTMARQDTSFPRMKGLYYISAPFDNTTMDVLYWCDDNTVPPEKPVFQSAIRNGETVRFVGTAPPNLVIRVFGEYDPQSLDIPFAFGLSSASGAFDFTVPLPSSLTGGYLRSQQGNWSSEGVNFTIT